MDGEEEVEGEVQIETLVLAEAILSIGEGLSSIATAINRLADVTAGEEFGEPEDIEEVYMDGKRR